MNQLLFLGLWIISLSALSKTLIISDSHGVGAFGEELVRLLEHEKEEVSLYAFGGTRPVDWVQGNNLTWGYWEHHTGRLNRRGDNRATPKLELLIQEHNPQRVLIVQGTNMVWRKLTPSDLSDIQFLILSVQKAGAECIWVGPPDLNVPTQENEEGVKAVHNMIGEETQRLGCSYIKSWTFTDYPQNQGDGVHYDAIPRVGKKLAQDWASGVYSRLKKP